MGTSHSNDIVISTLEAILYSEWSFLKDYLYRIELFLEDEKDNFEAYFLGQTETLSPTQASEFYEQSMEVYLLSKEFPKLLRNSFFVSAYSLLEHHLDVICKKLKEKQQIPINISDLHGNILRRAKLYWLLAKLAFPCDEKTWKEINNYAEVRNCIVHDNGLLKKANRSLINYANKRGIVSNDTNEPSIVLTRQFCEEAVQTMKNFVGSLSESI
jgi:hypothetical protein